MSTFLVTGVAGFIGYHVASRLLERGERVTGCDNLNDYYAVSLKEARLARLTEHAGFRFVRADLADRDATATLFAGERFDAVIHLAAQAGSATPWSTGGYIDSNLTGFASLLEGCRRRRPRTWSTPPPARSTAPTAWFLFSTTRWTTPSHSTPPPRRPTN